MSYLINNQQKMNEIIFAGRNKNYGAYAIRSEYGNTLLKSLMMVITGSGTLLLMAWYFNKTDVVVDPTGQIVPNVKIFQNVPVDLTPKDKTPVKKAAAAPNKPSTNKPQTSGAVTVVDSVDLSTPSPSVEISNSSTVVSASPGTVTGSGGNGDKPDGTAKKGDKEIRQLYGVDTPPEFEGGMQALYRFLASNIKYPEMASTEGKEGKVYVKFVVDENGKVGSLSLQNKAGFGLDEEALRVVNMIPKFKTPAKLDGEPVKVYYLIPINFKLK